jgi:predicted ArsR family transcriptional regulator
VSTIAVSTTRSTKRNRVYIAPLRNVALVAILKADDRRATAKEIGISPAYALVLEGQGLIKRVDTEPTGRPGRPPVVWTLTDKGVKRAKRAIKA